MDLENWLLTLHLRKINKEETPQFIGGSPGFFKNIKKKISCFGHLN
jgi:hypothetical protein